MLTMNISMIRILLTLQVMESDTFGDCTTNTLILTPGTKVLLFDPTSLQRTPHA